MIEKKKKWKLADFDYPLPEKYIAQYPAKRRDLSKLMVIHKDTGEIEHKISNGETFDKILESYSIASDEIIKIKNELK